MDDAVRRAILKAPLDDEPESEAEAKAVAIARKEIAAGKTLSAAEIDALIQKSNEP